MKTIKYDTNNLDLHDNSHVEYYPNFLDSKEAD